MSEGRAWAWKNKHALKIGWVMLFSKSQSISKTLKMVTDTPKRTYKKLESQFGEFPDWAPPVDTYT